MALLNDEPTLIDKLQRGWLVKEVGDAVATCTPPQVFGVHGDWGLGKTSFLHQLQLYLTGECPQQAESTASQKGHPGAPSGVHREYVKAVWFEAWRYQNDEVPVVALLQEIRSQLDWSTKLGQRAAKLTEVAVRGALLSIEDVTKKIGIQASKFQQAGEKWERDHLATALPSHTMRGFLADAIGKLLPDKGEGKPEPRLVVLIDDLDRCEAEAAFRLLEGLKIYLTLRNCVFVLGMNQRIIEDAISESVPGGDEAVQSRRAAAYLEKLCQNVWHLPAVQNSGELLCEWVDDGGDTVFLRKSLETVINELRSECVPPNPRRIKGLANLLRRMAPVRQQRIVANAELDIEDETRHMLVVAYVYQFHPDLYRRWEASPDLYDRIRAWVRGQESKLAFLDVLELPLVIETDESTPTPRYSTRSAYADPTESNVFWIQSLIHRLGDAVSYKDFLPYLRATGASSRETREQ